MPAPPIRVLLVDDSKLALAVMQRILQSAPDIEVAGCAANGKEALEMIPRLKPDLLCTDLHLAERDGMALTREVMARSPRPILVVSTTLRPDDTRAIFPLLDAGAVDVTAKPETHSPSDAEAQEFIRKVRIVAGVKVIGRRLRHAPAEPPPEAAPPAGASAVGLVVIGASTGGPQALLAILSQLPAQFPVPVLCIQHISRGFLAGMVEWLQSHCALRLRVAAGGETPQPGFVYFAPADRHLELDSHHRLLLTAAPPLRGHRPSVTITFQAAARSLGSAVVGVLLTGMGSDGAEGMRAVAAAGGITIAQDEGTSIIFGMPREAIALGAAQQVLPLGRIPAALTAAASGRRAGEKR